MKKSKKPNIKNIKETLEKCIKYIRQNPQILIKIIVIIIAIILIIAGINIIAKKEKEQKYVEYNGKNINESKYPGYKELIDELQKEHPNWKFTLFYTRLKWDDVIKNEGHKDNVKYPTSLIPDSSTYPDDWKCEKDKGKTFDNGTWVCASDKAVKYLMDPRNILNNDNIFEFLKLNYVDSAQTIDGLKYITKDTFLDSESVEKALLEAGKNANIDPYFITSRLLQEQGNSGTKLSKGYEYNDKTIYNPFNIGAVGNTSAEIIENAAKYAYDKNWDTLEKAIIGGIDYVKDDYINKGQDTLYLQKFDVVDKDNSLYKNQYMQNILAPQSEASRIKKIYKASNTIDSKLNFVIPLYEKIPKEVSEK